MVRLHAKMDVKANMKTKSYMEGQNEILKCKWKK